MELAPPRLWEGKQALMEALGAVGAVAAAKGVSDPGERDGWSLTGRTWSGGYKGT